MKTKDILRGALFCLAITGLGACNTFQDHEKKLVIKPAIMSQFLADKPAPLHPLYRNVLEQGERNIVLNYMRAGLAAIELGEFAVAEKSFDEVLDRIETIYADNPKAEEARSTFTKENIKDFKGEAYERAMAYYYRGILYLRRGDYDNARASFKGAMLQDTYAEDGKYQQDFALMAFLEGWASHCQANERLSAEAFAEALKLHKGKLKAEFPPRGDLVSDVVIPPSTHNVLLIAEAGAAPRKMATGDSNEKLVYFPPLGYTVDKVVFTGKGLSKSVAPFEDIFWQAHTRGGRPVDFIMEGKAAFKQGADAVGDVLVTAGVATALYGGYAGNDNAALAGGIMALTGLIAKGVAAAAKPDADLRQWDNLPEYVYFATAALPTETPAVMAKFIEVGGYQRLPDKKVDIQFSEKCGIGWVRSKSALDIPNDAPESSSKEYFVNPPTETEDENNNEEVSS